MPTLHWPTQDEDIGAASRAPCRLLEEAPSPFLGAREGWGHALLYNGALRDRSAGSGNAPTRRTLAETRAAAGGFDGYSTRPSRFGMVMRTDERRYRRRWRRRLRRR